MKAIIIGGGIAGPVTGMALAKAGIESTVYEAYPGPSDHAGLFLNTASNGIDALRTLDIDLRERVDGHPMPRMEMRNGDGRRLGTVANGITLSDGSVSLCVRRWELQRALRAEAESRGIHVEWGKRLVSYQSTAAGATAHFADGSHASGDFIVGADGIGSTTRRILDPAAPQPTYTGLLSIGGYTEETDLEPTPDTQMLVFCRRAFFGYLVRDSGEVWWFANVAHDDGSREDLREADTVAWKARLLELFSDDAPFIGDVIARAKGIGVHPIDDVPSIPTWHRGRAVLVGDAAHATSPNAGQGASMAMEDALVLARSLRDAPDLESAFGVYENGRRERAEKVVKYSRSIGSQKAPGPVGRFFRDLFMPIALRAFASPKSTAWLYEHRVEWEPASAGGNAS